MFKNTQFISTVYDKLHQTVNPHMAKKVLEAEREFNKILREYWYDYNFLTPQWWLLVALTIVPAIIWWKLVDRTKLLEILTFGLFMGMIAIILDSIGSNAMVWYYPVLLSPYLYPQLYPYDISNVIIPFMLVYQRWNNNFKKFLFFAILVSAFLAFIAEPTMELLGVYKEITWKNIYSFPIYILLAVVCYWIIYFVKTKMPNTENS